MPDFTIFCLRIANCCLPSVGCIGLLKLFLIVNFNGGVHMAKIFRLRLWFVNINKREFIFVIYEYKY